MNTTEKASPTREEYDLVILGNGTGGTLAAWTFAGQCQRVAVIERKYVGGSCPNIADAFYEEDERIMRADIEFDSAEIHTIVFGELFDVRNLRSISATSLSHRGVYRMFSASQSVCCKTAKTAGRAGNDDDCFVTHIFPLLSEAAVRAQDLSVNPGSVRTG